MLQWTEIIQSQARLRDAIILKVNVYFEGHTPAPSLTTMQLESGNKCTLYIFVVVYYLRR